MKTRNVLIGVVLAAPIIVAAWCGWRWYTTPVPPEVPLDGVEKPVVELVEKALQEVRRQPRSGAAWGELAMILAANGFDAQVVGCYAYAERFDPRNPCWPYLHGLQLLERSPHEAIPLFRQALALADGSEDQPAILFRLALALVEDSQFEEADQRLQTLRELESDSARVHFGLGLLALAQGDRPAAREHLRTLIDNPCARQRACAVLATLADEDKELAQRVAQLPPDQFWPDRLEARMMAYKVPVRSRLVPLDELERQGRHAEALDYLRQLVAKAPDAEVCYLLGITLYQRNDLEEAEQMLRASLRFNPKDGQTWFMLGSSLFQRGEKRYQEPGGKEAALELFRQAVAAEDQATALRSNHGFAYLTRGRALKYLGRTDESLGALGQALLILPESADVHLYLGEALAEAGQLREALEHLEDAVRHARPEDQGPRQALEKWRAKARSSP